jgi:hypothetical protein
MKRILKRLTKFIRNQGGEHGTEQDVSNQNWFEYELDRKEKALKKYLKTL